MSRKAFEPYTRNVITTLEVLHVFAPHPSVTIFATTRALFAGVYVSRTHVHTHVQIKPKNVSASPRTQIYVRIRQ